MSAYRARVTTAAFAAATAMLATPGAAHAATTGVVPQPRAVTVPAAFGDGSFEYPLAPAHSFTTLGVGQTIGPWVVSKGTVDHIGAGFWAASDGDQSVDLNGNQTGGVAQTFATTPGTKYRVTYSIAGNPGPPSIKTGRVLVNGTDAQDFTFDVTGKTYLDMGYSTETFEFTASLPQTTLTFDSTTVAVGGPSFYGPVLDNVIVTPECCNSCGTTPNPTVG